MAETAEKWLATADTAIPSIRRRQNFGPQHTSQLQLLPLSHRRRGHLSHRLFLREHKTSLANSFLAILHLPFPHSLELEAVKTRILDTIEPCLTEGRFDDYKII